MGNLAPIRQVAGGLVLLAGAVLLPLLPPAPAQQVSWTRPEAGPLVPQREALVPLAAQPRPEIPVWGNPRSASARPFHQLPAAFVPPAKRPQRAVAKLGSRPDTSEREVFRFIASRAGKQRATELTGLIVAAAKQHAVPPLLVAKVVHRESSYRSHVENGGCYGLMQVAAFHFRRGTDPCDPQANLEAGCKVLAGYHRRFGNWQTALTAYNFGPSATVSRGLTTSRYARQVLAGR